MEPLFDTFSVKSEIVSIPQSPLCHSISNLIPLKKSLIWIYFHSGVSQLWDVSDSKSPIQINEMTIPPDLYQTFAVSADKIGFYDHFAQKLRVIDLLKNEIIPEFWATLPTLNALEESKREDGKKVEEIARDNSHFCILHKSEMIILMETKMILSKEAIITVFSPKFCPEPFRQALVQATSMDSLNDEDTVIFYKMSSEYNHTFYVWNLNEDESKMRSFVISDKNFQTVIKVTDFGEGRFGYWANLKDSGIPEVGVVNYLAKKEPSQPIKIGENEMERIKIWCFKKEDWILSNVYCYFPQRNICLISKNSNDCTTEVIDLKEAKVHLSIPENNDLTRVISLDCDFFVDYEWDIGGDANEFVWQKEMEDSEGEEKNPEKIVQKNEKPNYKLVLNRIDKHSIFFI